MLSADQAADATVDPYAPRGRTPQRCVTLERGETVDGHTVPALYIDGRQVERILSAYVEDDRRLVVAFIADGSGDCDCDGAGCDWCGIERRPEMERTVSSDDDIETLWAWAVDDVVAEVGFGESHVVEAINRLEEARRLSAAAE